MTYKAWRAQREREGLSAEGGIANQTTGTGTGTTTLPTIESVPGSPQGTPLRSMTPVNDQNIALSPITDTQTTVTEKGSELTEKEKAPVISTDLARVSEIPETPETPIATSSKHRDSTLSMDADEDEDTNHAIPDEFLPTSGDNCAICIELLEDEDEVRGLTCGHCYHQGCIDPWLTQRRASCPLCKADYYIPKPPAETENANGTRDSERGNQAVTTEHWAPLFLRPLRPVLMPTNAHGYGPSYPYGSPRYFSPSTDANSTSRPSRWRIYRTQGEGDEGAAESVSLTRSWRSALRNPFRRHESNSSSTPAAADASTLERGEGGQ
jgi:hypothetical protein